MSMLSREALYELVGQYQDVVNILMGEIRQQRQMIGDAGGNVKALRKMRGFHPLATKLTPGDQWLIALAKRKRHKHHVKKARANT